MASDTTMPLEPLQHCTECRTSFPRQLTKQHGHVCDELRDFADRDDLDELSKRGLFRKQCPFCTEDFCYFHTKSECKQQENAHFSLVTSHFQSSTIWPLIIALQRWTIKKTNSLAVKLVPGKKWIVNFKHHSCSLESRRCHATSVSSILATVT